MAKRHHSGTSLISQIRRCQELILARSGVDDFNEAIRLLVTKAIYEREKLSQRLTYQVAQEILATHDSTISRFVDAGSFASPPEVIDECFEVLSSTRLASAGFEALDAAFEAMTSREYKAEKGQYFTPRHVVDFCVKTLRPKKGELFCDPACGSAAFLKSAYDFVGQPSTNSLFGFDISRRAVTTAELMSFLGCCDILKIKQLDSLSVQNQKLVSSQEDELRHYMEGVVPGFIGFDVIATNPPFAGDITSSGYADQYQLGRIGGARVERDVIFIERCAELLRPGGRLAIVLPDNKVSAQKFADVRRWLVKNMNVISVVSLHGYTFRPYTSQKAVVVFATKPHNILPQPTSISLYQSIKPGKTSSGELILVDGKIDHDLTQIQEDLVKSWTI